MSANEQIMIPASELVHEYVIKSKIEELEKIKAKFEDRILLNQTVAIQIIDKEIAELKGEQK